MTENSKDCDLLCTETNDLDGTLTIGQQGVENNSKDLSFRAMALIDLNDDNLEFMVQREIEFLPVDGYFNRLKREKGTDLIVRREALDWIVKAHKHLGFGELSFCLSVNYLDRFLSLYKLPIDNTWTVQLLAVACLSVAAKMEEINVPLIVDLQVANPTYVFEGKTIHKMELLVLGILEWRMRAYTPCTFVDYFVRKLNGDHIGTRALISRSMQLIVNTIRGIDFLKFRPSEIAAAVAMSVSGEIQANDIDKALPCLFKHIQKDRVLKCLELIQDLTLVSGTMTTANTITTTASEPVSPNGVLEAYSVGSYPSTSQTSPDTKRRRT